MSEDRAEKIAHQVRVWLHSIRLTHPSRGALVPSYTRNTGETLSNITIKFSGRLGGGDKTDLFFFWRRAREMEHGNGGKYELGNKFRKGHCGRGLENRKGKSAYSDHGAGVPETFRRSSSCSHVDKRSHDYFPRHRGLRRRKRMCCSRADRCRCRLSIIHWHETS